MIKKGVYTIQIDIVMIIRYIYKNECIDVYKKCIGVYRGIQSV